MKFFRSKAALAFITTISLMASSVAPVFAEGSRELTSIPAGDEDIAQKPGVEAYRPYFDWRDRPQFNMPSKNVVYVYANAGEKILFGSNVTEASDRSIQAVVEPEGDFTTTLSTNNTDYEGASIAVTLPEAGSTTTAYNPEGNGLDQFVSGDTLGEGAARDKVYLFNVIKGDTGHIADRVQEKNGPNGVDGTTDGYEPLSFTAPYTGTYSFRFLSSGYAVKDVPPTPAPDQSLIKTITIDFSGFKASDAENQEQRYDAEGLGTVYLANGTRENGAGDTTGATPRGYAVKSAPTGGMTLVDGTKYSKGKKYLVSSGTCSDTVGYIEFTPIHDDVTLEIVWLSQKTGNDSHKIRVQQGNDAAIVKGYSETEPTVQRTSVSGIKKGVPVKIWTTEYAATIYEIKYMYTQEGTGTVSNWGDAVLESTGSKITAGDHDEDATISGNADIETITLHGVTGYTYEYNAESGAIVLATRNSDNNPEPCIILKPKKDISELRIDCKNEKGTAGKTDGRLNVYYNGAFTKMGGNGLGVGDRKEVSTKNDYSEAYSNGFKAGEEIRIYAQNEPLNIYTITYICAEDPDAEGEVLEQFARKVEEPWADSPSEVAAWDITVATDKTKTWKIADITEYSGQRDNYTATLSGLTMKVGGGMPTFSNMKNEDNADISGLKLNGIKDNDSTNYLSYTPPYDGTLKASGWKQGTTTATTFAIEQNKKVLASAPVSAGENEVKKEISCKVSAGEEVKIYARGESSFHFYKVEFTPDGSNNYTSVPGRAWSDILFLNAGAYQRSIYSKMNILTEDGFLYNLKFNGIQPWSFIFYSNNRGFLLDPYSYSDWGNDKSLLQPLERSFFSDRGGEATDVGDEPRKQEFYSDGVTPIKYNGKDLWTRVLGNYKPVDKESGKDYTHKIFFNTPDDTAVRAYTRNKSLNSDTGIGTVETTLLEKLTYTGSGIYSDNSGEIHYGSLAIGGKFEIKFTEAELKNLLDKGVTSISVMLDFSRYELDDKGNPVTIEDSKGRKVWQAIDGEAAEGSPESKNKVSITAAVVPGQRNYSMTWDGRDVYGNIVPVGVYKQNVATYVELGAAHFPILDAEHNPNGIKVKMANRISTTGEKDTVYYNNSAVSPNVDSTDPTN